MTSLDLNRLVNRPLMHGSHESQDAGMCAMEMVAYIAGEQHSDHPRCACPVLTSFVVAFNDGLRSDEERDRLLRPVLIRLVGTRNPALEERRSWMAFDSLVREYTPAFLDLAGLGTEAERLRSLAEITDSRARSIAIPKLREAQQQAAAAWAAAWAAAGDAAWDAARGAAGDAAGGAAWDAAWDAAWGAAWAAAGDAAWDAARGAAWDAAGAAARGAAWAAAWDAARGAAWDAAWDAARGALEPTAQRLQQSALALLDRMLLLDDAKPVFVRERVEAFEAARS
jgi:hypothetical protein